MADGDGGAVAFGVAGGEFELLENGLGSFDVIEKNFAESGADSGALGGIEGDGRGGSAAVDEEKIAAAERVHEFRHELGIGGSERAFVIVDADNVRNGREHLREEAIDLGGGHAEAKFDRLGFCGAAFELHGEMEHDLIAAAMGFAGDFRRVQLIGQNGKSEWIGQFEERGGSGFVAAHVVNDDGEAGSGGRRARSCSDADLFDQNVDGMGALAIKEIVETDFAVGFGPRHAREVMAGGGAVHGGFEFAERRAGRGGW